MLNLARGTMAIVMCATIAASGCATAGATRFAVVPAPAQGSTHRAVLVEYVQSLPPGTAVRVDRARGRSLRGTLMKATGQSLFVQPRTRIPEGVVEISVDDVLGVTPDTQGGSGLGRAIGAGAAAGAGAALAVFAVLVMAFSD